MGLVLLPVYIWRTLVDSFGVLAMACLRMFALHTGWPQ